MILPPTHCPSCGSVLEWSNDTLYCRSQDCPAKSFKQVEHFASTLKIKGLGPATIEKLGINNIVDIYDCDIDFMRVSLGSNKLAEKLKAEIDRSCDEPLNTVLAAFGIPLIGKVACSKLATVADSIWDITEEVCIKAGLGPKATESLMKWLNERFEDYAHLPFSFKFSNETRQIETTGVVCITGKLKSFPTKSAAKVALEGRGYKVKDSLTKDVTILVNESGVETAKTKQAVKNGITYITNLKDLIGE